ncbi:MAG: hypothetical protein IKU17_05460, partial [Clostridia bacterium]|nr:hypothetical protein [Clostridia bacterium]
YSAFSTKFVAVGCKKHLPARTAKSAAFLLAKTAIEIPKKVCYSIGSDNPNHRLEIAAKIKPTGACLLPADSYNERETAKACPKPYTV